jgi:uncharacterized RDD family membrane protein YckC
VFCPNCGTENIAGARFCRSCGTALASQTPSPFGETAVAAPEYMGFWIRLLAYLIDGAIVGIVLSIAGGIVIGIGSAIGDTAGAIALLLFVLIAVVGSILYFIMMESSERQATFGKLALGMKVTDLDGRRISVGTATGRYFGKIVSGLLLYIGYIMIAFDERKQGLHDKLAGTLVVKHR